MNEIYDLLETIYTLMLIMAVFCSAGYYAIKGINIFIKKKE